MIVVDSGVLIAAADSDDRHHRACVDLVDRSSEQFVVPAGVVVEVCWMLGRRVSIDAEVAFLRSVGTDLAIEQANTDDYERMADLVGIHRDLRLGAVDAMVIAVAERLGARTVATIDRRDFSVVRPRHTAVFELVP